MKFIDLNLPSKTWWADTNTVKCTALLIPKKEVPSPEQFAELFKYCIIENVIEENVPSLKFTGTNGKSITIPLEGYGTPDFDITREDTDFYDKRKYILTNYGCGYYRTSETKDFHNVVAVFKDKNINIRVCENTFQMSMRTVRTIHY